MRTSVVLRYTGSVMLYVAAFMAFSAFISYINRVDSGFYPLLLSALLTAVLGVFPFLFVEKSDQISSKEGFCIVVFSWIMSCVVGMFPYLIWGGDFTLINAWFESVSGFTTTGASILNNNVEELPQGLLFWRSSTCWMGGVGVVMFALTILPTFGRNKLTLSSVEISSLAKDNYHYRAPIVVQILLVVYVGLTLMTTLLYKVAGMRWFDAVNHAMSACATGGFSTKNASIAFFNSPAVDWVTILAMTLSGIHFGLIYATIVGKRINMFRSEVVRTYFTIIAVASLFITLSLLKADIFTDFGTSLRYALFQFTSVFSTTGFATADTNTWTSLAVMLLIFGSIVCACAGSTSGGIKTDRLLLFIKTFRVRLRQQQHPTAIMRVKVDGLVQEHETLHSAMLFIVTYCLFVMGSAIFNALCGLDITTSVTSAISCISNVGPGFGAVGSMGNYSALPSIVKLQDTLLMLLGRLEIFGFIQFFVMKWWR